jgi:pantoate--beta-alanine ligase
VVGPLVRERDGLALSSRNAYLSTAERAQAAALARALDAAHRAFAAGSRAAAAVLHAARAELAAAAVEIEYADLVDPETLRPVHEAQASSVVAVAGRVGATRLIDNAPVGAGPEADPRVE